MEKSKRTVKTGVRRIALVLAAVFTGLCLSGCSGEFKDKSVVDAARKSGMNEISTAEFERHMSGGAFRIDDYDIETDRSPVYYVSENTDTANSLYAKHFKLDDLDIPGLEEFIACADEGRGFSLIYLRTVSAESAKKLFAGRTEFIKDDMVCYSGSKSGYDYTLGYYKSQSEDGTEYCECVYIKGRTVILLDAMLGGNYDRKTLDTFTKALGLVLPDAAKK